MLKKPLIWLALLLVASIAAPGWTLPNSLVMDLQINSKQGGKPVRADAKLWYANKKFRIEIKSDMKAPSNNVNISNKATVIMDINSKIGYLLDEKSKLALKIDQRQIENMTGGSAQGTSLANPTAFTDPAKVKAEIQKQGGKEVGKAKLLGHPCTIWQMTSKVNMPGNGGRSQPQNVTTKVWLADNLGVPLKVESNSDKMGQILSMQATKAQANVPVNNGLFGVPSGYQVRDLMDMMNK